MGHRFGRYESIRAIASGGMASVHLARSVGEGGFERLVAIKVMHPHIAEDPDFRAMFLDEARLAARIRHPNVVGVLDVQTDEDSMFLVMEYVDGPSLHHLRREFRKMGTTLPIGTVIRIFVDVLTGLHDAHELEDNDGQALRLIHRDISPQNILVGRDGVARITDFGVARAEARISSTRGGQLKGKIAYMCPEQIKGQHIDRRADVYGAGAALWEALTGKRLFRAESDAALVHMILGGAQQSPAELNDEVPQAVAEVCMRALSSEAACRPSTAEAFADELEDAAARAGVVVASQRHVASFIRGLPDVVAEPQPKTGGSIQSAPTIDEMPIPEVITGTNPVSGVSSLTPKVMVTSTADASLEVPHVARPLHSRPIVAAAAMGLLMVAAVFAASVFTSGGAEDASTRGAEQDHPAQTEAGQSPSEQSPSEQARGVMEPSEQAPSPSPVASSAPSASSATSSARQGADAPTASARASDPAPSPRSPAVSPRVAPEAPKPPTPNPKFLPKDL